MKKEEAIKLTVGAAMIAVGRELLSGESVGSTIAFLKKNGWSFNKEYLSSKIKVLHEYADRLINER